MKERKSKGIIAVVTIVLFVALFAGVVAMLSSGFKNMDVRSWVNGYKNVLKISREVSYSSIPSGSTLTESDLKWTQVEKAEIQSPSKAKESGTVVAVMLCNQDDVEYVNDEFTISSDIVLNDINTTSGRIGFVFLPEGNSLDTAGGTVGYNKMFVFVEYDSVNELMRVGMSFGYTEDPVMYSGWHDFEWYGIYDNKTVEFSVEKVSNDAGFDLFVEVNSKDVAPGYVAESYETLDEGWYDDFFIDGSTCGDYTMTNVAACCVGTYTTFGNVTAK